MQHDQALRKHLVSLITSNQAHADFDSAVRDLAFDLQGKRPAGLPYSPWELLEHMRIAQWDILEFSRNPNHKSPEFPDDYWPKSPVPPNDKAWAKSVQAFCADRQVLCELVEDESTDLFARIPHGEGQTVLREALLTADHNAYHIGQLVIVRRLLGAWH